MQLGLKYKKTHTSTHTRAHIAKWYFCLLLFQRPSRLLTLGYTFNLPSKNKLKQCFKYFLLLNIAFLPWTAANVSKNLRAEKLYKKMYCKYYCPKMDASWRDLLLIYQINGSYLYICTVISICTIAIRDACVKKNSIIKYCYVDCIT